MSTRHTPDVLCGACQKPAKDAVVVLHDDGRYSHLDGAGGWVTITIQGGNIAASCSKACSLKILEENKLPFPKPPPEPRASKVPPGWRVLKAPSDRQVPLQLSGSGGVASDASVTSKEPE